jgi:hypothetical protein
MGDSYQDPPGRVRDSSVRRMGRLTWRATQLGALATVGFAIVFARNAPAQTGQVQDPATVTPAQSATPAPPGTPRELVTSPSARKTAAVQTTAPAAQSATPTAAPTVAPSTPRLAPPATPPAPAPTTATPAPTTTSSASHGGG